MVEASETAADALVIFLPFVKVTLGVAPVLNSKPDGAFKTSVTFVPALISGLPFSAMTIGPSVVQAGLGAVAAVSAEIAPPPVALVIVTAALASIRARLKNPQIKIVPKLFCSIFNIICEKLFIAGASSFLGKTDLAQLLPI